MISIAALQKETRAELRVNMGQLAKHAIAQQYEWHQMRVYNRFHLFTKPCQN